MKILKDYFNSFDFRVKLDVENSETEIISVGDKISVDNGIIKTEGEFVQQLGRSFAGSYGEYKTSDGEIHIYDEFVHTVKKI